MFFSGSLLPFAVLLFVLTTFRSTDIFAHEGIDNSTYLSHLEAIEFLADAGQLSVHELNRHKHRFATWEPALLTEKEKKQTLWLRFTFSNNTQQIVNPMLSGRFQQQTPPEFYLKTESGITPLKLSQLNTIVFSLLPEQTAVVYLKTLFHPQLANLKLGSFDQIVKSQHHNQWCTGLISGWLISVLLANLWMFLLIRQNSKTDQKNHRIFRLLLAAGAIVTLMFMAAWQGQLSAWLHVPIALEDVIYKVSIVLISLTLCQLSVKLFGELKPPLICLFYIFSLFYLSATLWLPLSNNPLLPPALLTMIVIAIASFCLSFWLSKHNSQASVWLVIPLSASPLIFALNHSSVLIVASQDSTWFLLVGVALILGLLTVPKQTYRQSPQPETPISARTSLFDHETINSLSCEIRTPLNGVMGMTELLLSTQLSPKQKDYINILRYAGFEMGNLISLLMSNIKTTEQITPPNNQLTNIHHIIDQLIKRFHCRAQQQNIVLDHQIDDTINTACRIEEQPVTQILEALLFYALNQSQQGSVTLFVCKASSDKLAFELRLQSNVFDAKHLGCKHSFSETKTETPMGLNLYLATCLTKQLNGEISQGENNLTLILPYSSAPKGVLQTKPKSQSDYASMRVLIADNSKTCRMVLRQQCQLLGITFTEVENGFELLATIRSEAHLQRAFDAVILDQNLLGIKSLEIAKRVNNDPDIKTKPALILLTGTNSPEENIQFTRLGINSTLNKPASLFCLKTALNKALNQNHSNKIHSHSEV